MPRILKFDKKELQAVYLKEQNLHRVAAHFGVSRPAIIRHMDKLGVSRERKGGETISKAQLRKAYRHFQSTRKVATKFGTTRAVVERLMRSYGLPLRKRTDSEQHRAQLETLAKAGLLSKDIARKMRLNLEYVNELARRFGIPLNRFHKGHVITWNGYRMVKAKGHPGADAKGYVREHRLVVERHIGRYLHEDEAVHHINGDKLDNRLENLEVMSKRDHAKLHRKLNAKI